MRAIGFLTLITLLCAPVCIHAVETDARNDQLEMEGIGVKDKKEALPIYSPYAVTGSARLTTEVITREEIEAIKPQDFYDLFSRGAGTATSYQGRKYMNFLSMRGGDSNAVGIILDGFYIPSSQAGRILA